MGLCVHCAKGMPFVIAMYDLRLSAHRLDVIRRLSTAYL